MAISRDTILTVITGFGLTVASAANSQAALTYQTLNLTGLPAAGTDPGVNYDSFGAVSLSDSGHAVFLAGLQGPGVLPLENDRGVYLTDGITDTLVARGGDLPPGFVGDISYDSSTLGLFSISGGGESVVFDTQISGEGVNVGNNRGVFQATSAATDLVALESGWAPDAGYGVVFADINISATNESGQSVGSVLLDGVGVNSDNDGAVYSFGLGSTQLIAREGQQVPGAGPGTTLGFLSSGEPQISNAGQVTFIGPHSSGTGIFSHTESGGLQEVVLSGTAAPGAVAGTNFADFDAFSINDAGATLFRGFTDGPSGISTGLYLEEGGLQLLVERGQTAPGTFLNPEFDLFDEPLLNGAGDVAFNATLMGAAINDSNNEAIYKIIDGSLEFVSRKNDLIPDATDAARFGNIDSFYFNDAGQVAFLSDLQGENVDDSNGQALFAEVGGQLRLIARRGDLFDVDSDPLSEDLREVAFLTAVNSVAGSQDGRTSPFNSAGQLLFSLSLTDGSQGVFVAETGLVGDYNFDGIVDAADYTVWRDMLGSRSALAADGNRDGVVNADDYELWRSNFGLTTSIGNAAMASTFAQSDTIHSAVPEPTALRLFVGSLLFALARSHRENRTSAGLHSTGLARRSEFPNPVGALL